MERVPFHDLEEPETPVTAVVVVYKGQEESVSVVRTVIGYFYRPPTGTPGETSL